MSLKRTRPGADTLSGRLTRRLMLWVGGVWLACVLGTVWYVDREIDRNFDNELVEVAHRMFDIALRHLDDAPARADGGTLTIPSPGSFADADVLFRLVTPQGRVLAQAANARAAQFEVPLAPGFANHGDWRVHTVRHPVRAVYLQVADPLRERRRAVRHTLIGLTLPLAAVLPLLALLLRRIARRELQPLEELRHEIGQRGGERLVPIALTHLPRELASVQDDVNHLLERLAQALEVERALAANAAHELRTPLTAARLRLQTALEHGLQREDVQAALDALQTLSHRAEKLLQLSRAESSTPLTREPVDLARLATTMAQEFWQQDESTADRLDLVLPEATAPAMALGDFDALAIALRNLLENALRHGDGSAVELIVGPGCTLTVRDHGPGVPPERLRTLRERHARPSGSRTGYGLGLSIVTTIVRKHGGRLELTSPLPDASVGLQATLVLQPVDPSQGNAE